MSVEFRVPPMGPKAESATITRWYAEPGDAVKRGEVLLELQAEPFYAELAAPADGVLGTLQKPAGATVREGDLLATID